MTQFTNNSTSSFDVDEMLNKMRELSDKTQSFPNILIMTTRTLGHVRQLTKAQEQQYSAGDMPSLPMNFSGIPVEDYATVKECFDRMMNARPGERLKLYLSEAIPIDCLEHPFVAEQVKSMASRCGLESCE